MDKNYLKFDRITILLFYILYALLFCVFINEYNQKDCNNYLKESIIGSFTIGTLSIFNTFIYKIKNCDYYFIVIIIYCIFNLVSGIISLNQILNNCIDISKIWYSALILSLINLLLSIIYIYIIIDYLKLVITESLTLLNINSNDLIV